MLYRAHLVAGVGLGVALAAAARSTGAVTAPEDVAALIGVTAVFALLPDLDTASVVQRWFYRGMLGVPLWLMGTGRAEHAAFLGAVSLLPLVHRHRGWMHAWWAVLAVPLAALVLWDGYWAVLRLPNLNAGVTGLGDTLAGLGSEVMARLANTLTSGAPFAIAMVTGYGLHLLLDFHVPAWVRWGRIL